MAHLTTISGTYRNGVVELSERPPGVPEDARVLVTFLTEHERRVIDESREAADRMIARMEAGIPFGGAPYPSREELHDRHDRPRGSR